MFARSQHSQELEPKAHQSRIGKPARIVFAVLVAPVLMLFSAGCAQKQSPSVATLKPHGLSGAAGSRVAGAKYAEVELEDDGREAQQPPLLARKPVADDPTEPFSPNYGRASSNHGGGESARLEDEGVSFTPIHAEGPAQFQYSMHN